MKSLNDTISLNNPKLKEIFNMLDDALSAFSQITNVPVTFYNSDGHISWEVNAHKKACISNSEYFDPTSSCHKNLRFAMKTSRQIGDVYIFVCNSGLTNMCYAFLYDNELIGYFNAGPILMGKKRANELAVFFQTVPKDRTDFAKLINLTEDMKIYSPIEVTYLSRLYTNCFISTGNSLQDTRSLTDIESSEKAGMKIVDFKDSELQINYPFETEEQLKSHIRKGNSDKSSTAFSKYISDLLVYEGGNISVLKLRLLTFFGKLINDDFSLRGEKRNISILEPLDAAKNLTEISMKSRQIVDTLTESYSQSRYTGKSSIVCQAIDYIENNYTEEINLNVIANEIHVNNAYLSTLFKRETGISIIDYIHDAKLAHAADMLAKTNTSITDIAMTCGYRSPSHFAKLFNQKYKETPRQYRNSHRV